MKALKTSVILSIILLFSAAVSAGVPQKRGHKNGKDAVKITVKDFNKKAPELVGKKVVIEGVVKKIHKNNNKGFTLTGDNMKGWLNVFGGKNVGPFSKDMEGEHVRVTGIVREKVIDENTIKQAEEKGKEKLAENFRKRLEKAGKDRVVVYSIRAKKVEILK